MNMASRLLLILIVLVSFCDPVMSLERIKSNPGDDWHKLISLDKELMQKSADLMLLTAKAQRRASNKYKYRKWIDLGGQEASASGLLAATAIGVDELGPNLNRPLNINVSRLRRGLNAGVVCSIIGASASASQLGIDGIQYLVNRKKGFTPRVVARNFVDGMNERDRLWIKREKLIQGSPNLKASKVVQAATRVHELRRELIAREFYHVFSFTMASNSAQSIYYGFDISRNVAGAIGINLFKKALKKPYLNEPGSIWLIVSSGITIAAPWVSTGAGKAVGKFARWRIRKKLHFNPKVTVADLQTARSDLRLALASANKTNDYASIIKKSAILDESHGLFEERVKALIQRKQKLRRTAFQQKFASALIGGQFLGFSTAALVGWQKYGTRGRIFKFNRTLYAAEIVGLTGSSLAVGATGMSAIGGEIHEYLLKRKKQRSSDLLNHHIERLERVKAEIIQIEE